MSGNDAVLKAITSLLGFRRRGRSINEYEKANSRSRIHQTKPWLRQRIGRIEAQALRVLPHDGKPMSTGEIARAIYEPILKPKDAPPFRLKTWQRDNTRRALPTFADNIGRSPTGKGRGFLWRIRWGYFTFEDARAMKLARRDKNRRKGLTFKGRRP